MAKQSSSGWCNSVGNVEFGLTGKSRTRKKLDSNTGIPPPLSFLSISGCRINVWHLAQYKYAKWK